ncbi:MAG: hypothetical protein ACKOAG_02765, partial [Candidatus Kapaibacterium sp.]
FFGANVRVRVSLAGVVTEATQETETPVGVVPTAEGASRPVERVVASASEEPTSVERFLVEAFKAKKIPMPGTS